MLPAVPDHQDPVMWVVPEVPSDEADCTERLEMLRRQIDEEKPFHSPANLRKLETDVVDVWLVAELVAVFLEERLSNERAKVLAQCDIQLCLQGHPPCSPEPGDVSSSDCFA